MGPRASAGAAVVLTAVGLAVSAAGAQPPSTGVTGQTVVEVRVHGNQSITAEEVLAIAGVAVGDRLGPNDVATIEQRLLESGRFDDVEVRTRYRSLTETDEVALVLVVRERAGAAANPASRLLGAVGRRMLVLPVLGYAEGDGVTYGARLAFVDIVGTESRVSVPATWGGRKQIGAELDISFREGSTRLRTGGAFTGTEHPHFKVDDERGALWGAFDQRLPANVLATGRVEWSDVSFGQLDDRLMSYQVALEFDTRRTLGFPRDAIFATVGYEWLDASSAGSVIGRPRGEVQAYQSLLGQSVLAVRVAYSGADRPLPLFEKPLFGGPPAVRGWRVGSFVGDRLAVASVELRLPLTSPFSIGDAGVKAFYDTGAVFNVGESIHDTRFRQGAGLGVFFSPPFAELGLDVAHNLIGQVRVHVIARLGF